MKRVVALMLMLSACSENVDAQRRVGKALTAETKLELERIEARLTTVKKLGVEVTEAEKALEAARASLSATTVELEKVFAKGKRIAADTAVNRERRSLTTSVDAAHAALVKAESASKVQVTFDGNNLVKEVDVIYGIDEPPHGDEFSKLELAARQCRGNGELTLTLKLAGGDGERPKVRMPDGTLAGNADAVVAMAGNPYLTFGVYRNKLERFYESVRLPKDAWPTLVMAGGTKKKGEFELSGCSAR